MTFHQSWCKFPLGVHFSLLVIDNNVFRIEILLVEIKYVWFNYSYRHTWVMLSQLVVKTWPESVRNASKWCRFLSYIGWIFPLSRTLTFIPLQNFFKLWNGQLCHKLNHSKEATRLQNCVKTNAHFNSSRLIVKT